jgi:hypothetical protein
MYSSAAVVRREKVRNGLERTKLAIETGSDGTRMHKGARKRERDGKWSLRHILNSSRTEFQTSSPNRRHISGGWDLECHYVTRANLVFPSSQQLLIQTKKNTYKQVLKKKITIHKQILQRGKEGIQCQRAYLRLEYWHRNVSQVFPCDRWETFQNSSGHRCCAMDCKLVWRLVRRNHESSGNFSVISVK